jgi:pSer/pThr/pTyr-binding forkhead associated (FHA) protein
MAEDRGAADPITLILLHPTTGTPLQKWTFHTEPLIRIGRAPANDVVIPSDVVSRHHAELRLEGREWVLIGLGSNGTFLDGERVDRSPVRHGQAISLAPSGPTFSFSRGAHPEFSPDQTTHLSALAAFGIEIDERKKVRQVSEIAESDYFQRLQKKASELRERKPESAG